jgi:hypothetical protein
MQSSFYVVSRFLFANSGLDSGLECELTCLQVVLMSLLQDIDIDMPVAWHTTALPLRDGKMCKMLS